MSIGSMPAIVVRETGPKGSWNTLAMENVERPVPQAGEVLVQVEACSVNRADLLQRRGLYPPPPSSSDIPGLDFAGFIALTAPNVENWHSGDRVFGILAGGGYGRYVAVPSDHLVPIPPNLSFIEAAAAGEVFFTAYLNLFMEANARAGEVVLVHGGGSGVGTAAIQLGVKAGLRVVVTAGSEEKIRKCMTLGAWKGINYHKEAFWQEIVAVTENRGVDIILDPIGASYLNEHLKILAVGGRLVLIGLMGGNKADIHLAPLLSKRLRLIGSVLRSRSRAEKTTITKAFTEQVLPLLRAGTVRPIIDRVYPVGEVEAAHEYMRDGRHFGKIVLTWQSENGNTSASGDDPEATKARI